MRILVLTFYYEPDLCAGSFRVTPLVQELRRMAPPGSDIHVVTTLPNRYRSFRAAAEQTERQDGLTISRIPLPEHRSGMLDQSRAFASFARGAWSRVRANEYDLVFATSSRLMTMVLGAEIARRKRAKFYADVRDIFVDNIRHLLPPAAVRLALPVLNRVEARSVLTADRVNLVSPGFEDYFRSRYPHQRFSFFTNGIDPDFLDVPLSEGLHPPGRPATVLYAGNIGEGQGLHAILPALAVASRERLRFRIIGDGARRDALARALAAAGVDNVELLPPVSRRELVKTYQEADMLFLHLNDFDSFRRVLPSKIFEYAALGKPLWAGVAGYSADFLRKEVPNAAVFTPCDATDALRSYESLAHCITRRDEFIARYDRGSITRQLAADILDLGGCAVAPAVLDPITRP